MQTHFTHSDFELVPTYDDGTVYTVAEYAFTRELAEWNTDFPTHITVDGVEYKQSAVLVDYPLTNYAQYTNGYHPDTVYELIG